MSYKIGVLGNDFTYIKRLTDFIESHYSNDIELSWGLTGLDGLNIDTVKYDALLISDDIDVNMAKIPSNTKVISLTSKLSDRNGFQILKFQRLEEIYKQMMEICSSEIVPSKPQKHQKPQKPEPPEEEVYNYSRFADFELSTRRSNEGVYRVFKYSDSALGEPDSLDMGMLENNNIRGIARLTCKDGELTYNITGKQSLLDYVAKNSNDEDGRAKLQKVFGNILSSINSLDEYMLDANNLVLNPNEIYVDKNTLDTALLYYPFETDDAETDMYGFITEVIDVCKLLLKTIDNASGKGTMVFAELQKQADESMRTKKQTVKLEDANKTAYLVRKRTGEKIVIDRNVFKIGKDANYVDYCIKGNPTVSRNHADVVKKADGYYAIDKGSLNHTFLNGKRLEDQQYAKLEDGDLLQVADEVFEFNIK